MVQSEDQATEEWTVEEHETFNTAKHKDFNRFKLINCLVKVASNIVINKEKYQGNVWCEIDAAD